MASAVREIRIDSEGMCAEGQVFLIEITYIFSEEVTFKQKLNLVNAVRKAFHARRKQV